MSDHKLSIRDHGPIREFRLHRPEVHNALDEELIGALTDAFAEVAKEVDTRSARAPRGVVLSAEGPTFCAGADVQYMKRVGAQSVEQNRDDARRTSRLFQAIRCCPVYTVARVHGHALGGGSGLIACADMVVAVPEAKFGFTEVQFGILPAMISPFVLDRIGLQHGRTFFPTGEKFDAAEAQRIGLVDRVVPAAELDAVIAKTLRALLSAGPDASRAAKRLIDTISWRLPLSMDQEQELEGAIVDEPELKEGPLVTDPYGILHMPALMDGSSAADAPRDDDYDEEEAETSVFEETARWIAFLRGSDEGREGMAAFLEKRKARWAEEAESFVWPPMDLG